MRNKSERMNRRVIIIIYNRQPNVSSSKEFIIYPTPFTSICLKKIRLRTFKARRLNRTEAVIACGRRTQVTFRYCFAQGIKNSWLFLAQFRLNYFNSKRIALSIYLPYVLTHRRCETTHWLYCQFTEHIHAKKYTMCIVLGTNPSNKMII